MVIIWFSFCISSTKISTLDFYNNSNLKTKNKLYFFSILGSFTITGVVTKIGGYVTTGGSATIISYFTIGG